MDGFDAAAATAAAGPASPESPGATGAAGSPADTSFPVSGPAAPAIPEGAPAAGRPVAHLSEEVAVEFIDQGLYMVLKRKAKRLGLRIGPADRDALRLSDVEKDELLLFAPGVMPYLAQYADLIGKLSLALFGFALWSIYQDKAELLDRASKIASEQSKPQPGFAAGRPAGNGNAPFDPGTVKGIPPHAPSQ